MITVRNVFDHLNKLADIKLAEKWDNVGLMLGDFNSEVKNVLVCLDVTTTVVNEAITNNIDLIISHHPLIFKPLKSLDFTVDFKSNIIKSLVKNDISVISFHTNLDSATYGLNDFLAKKLELKNIRILFEHKTYKNAGLGRIGELSEEFTQKEFITYIKEKFNLETISAVLGNNDNIKTGDVGYHVALDALEMKKNIIDVGHFTEHLVKDLLLEYIGELSINVQKSKVEQSPFKTL